MEKAIIPRLPARKTGAIRITWFHPFPEKDPMDQNTTCFRLSPDSTTKRLVMLPASMEKMTPVRIMVLVERLRSIL